MIPDWIKALEYKWDLPIEQIPGHVYILCFDVPRIVKSVSKDYPCVPDQKGGFKSTLITHYVGWTQMTDPRKRVYAHGAGSARAIAVMVPGTVLEEQRIKDTGLCPRCGVSLRPLKYPGLTPAHPDSNEVRISLKN